MFEEVKLMSSVKEREKVRKFGAIIESMAKKPEDEEISMKIGDLKALMNVVRDFAVMTHVSDSDSEAAAAMVQVADYVDQASLIEPENPRFYKTTALASSFGVSVTAINKWIAEGRFIGYKRPEAGKQAKIPYFTPFRLRDGSVKPLGQLVESNDNRTDAIASFADDDEQQLLLMELGRLKEKYGKSTYVEAFGKGELSPSEEADASWWSFYENKLSELKNGKL